MKRERKRRDPRPYNVRQIRDFLDHLRWELIVRLHQNQHGGAFLHDEQAETLHRFLERRQCVVLLAPLCLDAEWMPESVADAARDAMSKAETLLRQPQLEALESLQSLFDEALECASHPTFPCGDDEQLT